MTDLTNIFPTNYPNPPMQEEIEILFQDILNRTDSVDSIVFAIEQESCPYYKEALTHCLADKLNDWYKRKSDIVGLDYGDCWIPYWQQPKDKIQQLLNKFETEQQYTQNKAINTQPSFKTKIPTPHDELQEQMPSNSNIASQLKNAIMQVVKDISEMQLSMRSVQITIENMPITIQVNSQGINIDKNTADITSYEQSKIYNR